MTVYLTLLLTALCSKDREIAGLHQKVEDDQSEVAALQKKIRELEARIEELEEDLENEKSLRHRVSETRRTGDVCVCACVFCVHVRADLPSPMLTLSTFVSAVPG